MTDGNKLDPEKFLIENFSLWERVELSLAIWCAHQEKITGESYKCECLSVRDLQEYDKDSLNRLQKALEDKTYQGDVLSYLDA